MFTVEMGVKGAMRIITKEYDSEEEALKRAERWSESNSTGHYWAQVKSSDGNLIRKFN